MNMTTRENESYLHTIVEIEEFTRRAEKLLTAEERGALFDYLSQNPKAGTVIQGTGGVRKLRWAIRNKGKSGGVRVIYYYHNINTPLFAITLYAKSDQENITQTDKHTIKQLVSILTDHYSENS